MWYIFSTDKNLFETDHVNESICLLQEVTWKQKQEEQKKANFVQALLVPNTGFL